MRRIEERDYQDFLRENKSVSIGQSRFQLGTRPSILEHGPPADYELETGTVWSFPSRGGWATHRGDYRGNWSPYIPRNLILKYSAPGEVVLDQMCGSGTTLVECKLLGRNGMGVDVNLDAIMVCHDRLGFEVPDAKSRVELYLGDARDLDLIEDGAIDLVATHPPYAEIIPYTGRRVDGDLSGLKLPDYLKEMRAVAEESMRVLKPGRICAVLIGDTRRHLHYVPISAMVLERFLEAGFVLKEDIIKVQWKMKATRERWRGRRDFYKIAHEHLYVFRKPLPDEKLSKYKYSMMV